jgi:hypothetical protein
VLGDGVTTDQTCHVRDAVGAGVGGDPITYFNGAEYKFLITNGQLTKLLQTQDLVVSASGFPGEEADEQWIDRIVVETTGGEIVADIKIRNMTNFDKSKAMPLSLETLELKLLWHEDGLVQWTKDEALLPWGKFMMKPYPFEHPQNVTLDLLQSQDHRMEGVPRREALIITSASMRMAIMSAAAFEFYYNDEADYRGWKYAHLDIEFLELKNVSSWSGLLPEIWGIKAKRVGADAHPASRGAIKNTRFPDMDRHELNRHILVEMLSSEHGPGTHRGTLGGVCGNVQCSSVLENSQVTV